MGNSWTLRVLLLIILDQTLLPVVIHHLPASGPTRTKLIAKGSTAAWWANAWEDELPHCRVMLVVMGWSICTCAMAAKAGSAARRSGWGRSQRLVRWWSATDDVHSYCYALVSARSGEIILSVSCYSASRQRVMSTQSLARASANSNQVVSLSTWSSHASCCWAHLAPLVVVSVDDKY